MNDTMTPEEWAKEKGIEYYEAVEKSTRSGRLYIETAEFFKDTRVQKDVEDCENSIISKMIDEYQKLQHLKEEKERRELHESSK